ncbi:S1 family peptidase [Rhodoferax antarcticus]|uniref:Trypsin family protein n=1 Tax=Rhodoferax antarcticus ANT.BR TaxID=1111071 RepID=A0A1Q8YH56_9BURK|nr:serine protease [Rhodoferax antarcticus]APW45111.1 serine protease [Rhodoferax antarcticus]MCW2313592.1 S1-C subfamily serine protease [Rhodoferax antarcticus]OLP07332.1 trypsin family protein [Rhodoferax antarcticus ANT.BR]
MKREPILMTLALFAALSAATAHADLASTIAQVKPAIAIVGTYKATNSPRFALHGTGFVVADAGQTQGNKLVTNAHVLQRPAEADAEATLVVQLRTSDNNWQTRAAKVLEVDGAHDLALLRFEGPAHPAFPVGNSDAVREGQSVAFMGFPIGGALGFSPVTHRATISSIAAAALPTATASQLNPRAIRSLRGNKPFDIFQLDGTAYPGNSGGPLFDPDSGEVLGVVNMVLLKSTRESALSQPSGISYAIPSRFVLALLQRHAGD